jgi:hypothetical protein
MSTIPFLDYLHENRATRTLAVQLAGVLALRGRADLIPTTRPVPTSRRIAS